MVKNMKITSHTSQTLLIVDFLQLTFLDVHVEFYVDIVKQFTYLLAISLNVKGPATTPNLRTLRCSTQIHIDLLFFL